MEWTKGVRFQAQVEIFSLRYHIQTGSGAHSTSYHWVPVADLPGYSGRGVKLTTHLHLVPMLRMREAIPPLSHAPSYCGT